MNKGLSVIIRNRNEADYIGFAIQSVLDNFRYVKKEIIIIDNESTDDSLYVASLFNDQVDILTISISKNDYTPGKALNMGFNRASFDTVLVLSAHCQITQVIDSFDWYSEFDVVFGRQVPIYRGKKITPRYVWSNFQLDLTDTVNPYSKLEKRYFLHNAFAFYRREIVLNQPFDEHLSGKEDRYWADTFIKSGGETFYTSDLSCNHFFTSKGATWKGLG